MNKVKRNIVVPPGTRLFKWSFSCPVNPYAPNGAGPGFEAGISGSYEQELQIVDRVGYAGQGTVTLSSRFTDRSRGPVTMVIFPGCAAKWAFYA